MADLEQVNKGIDNINTGLKAYVQLSDLRIKTTLTKVDNIAYQLLENAEIRTAVIQTSLDRAANVLLLRASYGTLRLTVHSSPELVALTLTLLWVYRVVNFILIVTKVLNILAVVWRIHQIILALWPEYRASWEKLMNDVSKVSNYIGWGVDGIGHLITAVSAGVNVLGGVMGKNWDLMRFEMMEKANDLVLSMSRMLGPLQDDPGRWLAQLFENRTLLVANDTAKWWTGVSEWIQEASDTAKTALQGAQGVLSELSAIQENMPEVVRANIPTSIWRTLATNELWIQTRILPHLTTLDQNLEIMNSLMDSISQRGSDLADKLANPGDLLIGVDELSPWVKKYQEGLIDDVTSREFEFWTDEERGEIQSGLDDFERIDRLLIAPTPEPGFLTMEVKPGQTIRGITAEPHETWFPGGYNDPR